MKLSTLVTDYLAYKRALGQRFVTEGVILQSFCRQLGDGPVTDVTADRARAFIQGEHTSAATAARKHRALAGLYRYASVRYQVALSALPQASPEPPSSFVPYIYSQEELKGLLDAAAATCSSRTWIESYVLRALLLVLYGAGLRLNEALALNGADVDLEQTVLTIRRTKFYKTRLVPLGHDLARAVHEYRRRRDRQHPPGPTAPFFCFRNGRRVSASALERTFRRLRATAGVRREGGARHQPRLHDLRHAAAVHRVMQWYRSGADLQRLLPHLATYLGHVDLSSTQRYLTLTPQLLNEASLRFERYAKEHAHD
jgi:integrase/recombinase XerD